MENVNNIGQVEHVSLTVLVDNKADLMVESSDHIQYFTDEPLLAEHGFSVLIRLDDSESQILWDAGVSKVALIENIRRMKIDPSSITKIALSHGHLDHYAGMTDLLITMEILPKEKEWGEKFTASDVETWMDSHKIPIAMHPAAVRERWWMKDDGTLEGPFLPPPQGEWQAAGAKIILSEIPYKLGAGCWTTGFIQRNSFEKSGRPSQLHYRRGSDLIRDDLDEDQAIGINVKGKGLIILSACAHSGIVNTVEQVKQFFGIDKIYAILGGFHLAEASDDEIRETIDRVKDFGPKFVIPSHCTGFRAISQFALEMPDEFIEGVVGAKYLL